MYGELEAHEGRTKQPFCYNGRDGVMTDPNGLYYMRARYYHPGLKRFLNRDVLQGDMTDGQTFNRFAYVNGDPIGFIDPLGLMKCKDISSDLGISKVNDKTRGHVILGELDHLNRPTGIVATITKDMIGTGSEALSSIKPPGSAGGKGTKHARGHLLAKILGGSGKDKRNLVTLFQNPTNSPLMRDLELKIRDAVKDGEIIRYRVIPIYDGANPIPKAVTMQARGTNGFQLDISILNKPKK
ncbi:DNA/RNA non-specific endonuclease [Brevibacillus sp. HB1.1]|uniref:DNA/RNA non-specific endonuclease n=1 Tax=Brevibacillus sp. HB1.1 TaxID=2738808 RepID=UPI0020C7211B|nr:DNA/RNA non-specific endonuclease [Brevibacillus sp. HB1.1]